LVLPVKFRPLNILAIHCRHNIGRGVAVARNHRGQHRSAEQNESGQTSMTVKKRFNLQPVISYAQRPVSGFSDLGNPA
jgi:hypothetical protein